MSLLHCPPGIHPQGEPKTRKPRPASSTPPKQQRSPPVTHSSPLPTAPKPRGEKMKQVKGAI